MSLDRPQDGAVHGHNEIEIPLTEILAPLRRRFRLVVLGTAGCWIVLLLALLLTPPRYVCEGVLAFPNVAPFTTKDLGTMHPESDTRRETTEPLSVVKPGPWGRRKGIPLALYKFLERSLADGDVLHTSLASKLSPAAIERLRRDLSESVSVLASGAQDDLQKLDREDTVTGVQLSFSSYRAAAPENVVRTLASVVRETLATRIALEQLAVEAYDSRESAREIGRRRAELESVNTSLETLGSDLARVMREQPAGAGSGSRQVVDVQDGGDRFLPLPLQMIATKVRHAQNEHTIRVYDQALARHALRLRFFDRLRQRLEAGGSPMVEDVPQVIGRELEQFLREQHEQNSAVRDIQAEVQGLRDQVASWRDETHFVQYPTTHPKPRAALALAAAALALLFFVAVAFVADLWERSGGRGLEPAGSKAGAPSAD